jgi:hypothetical protein
MHTGGSIKNERSSWDRFIVITGKKISNNKI